MTNVALFHDSCLPPCSNYCYLTIISVSEIPGTLEITEITKIISLTPDCLCDIYILYSFHRVNIYLMASNRVQYKRNWATANRIMENLALCVDNESDEFEDPAFQVMHQMPTNLDDNIEVEEPGSPQSILVSGDQASGNSSESNHIDSDNSLFDSDEDNIHILEETSLSDDLRDWTNFFLIKHNALDSLLGVLKKHGHTDLPSSARGLLLTPRNITVVNKSGMEYVHFSLETQLVNQLKKYPADSLQTVDTLSLGLNVDGLPLFKSSSTSLWPVLCSIVNLRPVTVFPVSLALGPTKPNNLDFLDDIVDDLKDIIQGRLAFGEHMFSVCISHVVCDAPARALVKGIKLCTGYYGCDKCTQPGVWLGRVTYPLTRDLQLRTDMSFRAKENQEHHHQDSPFCELPIDMITQFPIDYMHQLCLGVMKKLLLKWLRGNHALKISAVQVAEISERLLGLKQFVPVTFVRKPRGLDEVDRWKATEYRQFLLYTGKIVLRGILRQDLYEHFLCLSVASCILVSPSLAQLHKEYAKQLMQYFVEQGMILYGQEFLVYNVHSMVHLSDNIDDYGCLDNCSAFLFENYMQQLKRLIRSGKKPVVQIAKRLSESSGSIPPVPEEKVSSKSPNNAFVLNNSSCCEVVNRHGEPDGRGDQLFCCRVYERTEPYFVNPCDSRLVGIHKANLRWTCLRLLSSRLLTKRAMKVDLGENQFLFMALLHTNIQ